MHTSHPPRKTFVDYAAVAVCPGLIMLLVGSLIFFLLAVGYAGSHLGELRWTFFWFVLAMVLVSRIAIEKGSDYAGVYGLCLALATAFMLSRYVAVQLWLWGLLALIWWATNKLTWDCTVIEDDQDASGEGLLQAAKLDPHQTSLPSSAPPAGPLPPKPDRKAPPIKRSAKVPWWDRMPAQSSKPKKPHAPGIWIIYFSLGALPLFGLGQGFIPPGDAAAHQHAFFLLAIYLAAALGLLLITSFLGLRRYLRQRYLQMPAAMAASWLTAGTVLASAILLGCLLLPRPRAYWSLTAMVDRLGDPPKAAQKQTAATKRPDDKSGSEGKPQSQKPAPGETTDSSSNPPAPDTQSPPPAEQAKGGQPTGQSASAPTSNTQRSEPPQSTVQSDAVRNSQKATGTLTPPSPARPAPTLSLQTPLKLLRLGIYAALVVLSLILLIKYRHRFWWLLLDFWRALRELWNGLFARTPAASAPRASVPTAAPRRPFASFPNPFASGAAMQMPLEELIIQTFQGLEAWAEEHRLGRHPDQTPFEFAEQVAAEVPDLAHEAQQVARLYAQIAYAQAAVQPASRTVLEILWSKMTHSV